VGVGSWSGSNKIKDTRGMWADASGKMDKQNFDEAIEKAGLRNSMTADDLESMFDRIDEDNNGELTLDEVSPEFWNRNPKP
jgi:Ca2+-binding EF-hand superfamily protein